MPRGAHLFSALQVWDTCHRECRLKGSLGGERTKACILLGMCLFSRIFKTTTRTSQMCGLESAGKPTFKCDSTQRQGLEAGTSGLQHWLKLEGGGKGRELASQGAWLPAAPLAPGGPGWLLPSLRVPHMAPSITGPRPQEDSRGLPDGTQGWMGCRGGCHHVGRRQQRPPILPKINIPSSLSCEGCHFPSTRQVKTEASLEARVVLLQGCPLL